MIVGHLNAVSGKGGTQIFVQGIERGPVIRGCRPAADGVLDGAGAIVDQIDLWGGIGQHAGCGGNGLHTGGFYRFRRGIIGCGHIVYHPAAAQRGIVDDPGGGQLLVGQHHDLTVCGFYLGVVQGDLLYGAQRAAGLNHIPQPKGAGGEDYQTTGHIAQNILGSQRYTQCQHRHDGRQRGGVDTQRLRGDDSCQHIKDGFDGGENDLLQPVVDAAGAAYQPPGQLHDQLHHQQTQQQRHNGGENVTKGESAQRGFQDIRNVVHGGRLRYDSICQYNRFGSILQTLQVLS